MTSVMVNTPMPVNFPVAAVLVPGPLRMRRSGGYKRIAALTGYSLNTVKSVCRRNPNGEEKLCLQCGAKLVRTPHYKEKKFCSDTCRMA